MKTAVLQLCGGASVLWPFDVAGNLTVQTDLSAGGADERRNSVDYQLNSATWCVRSGELKVGLMTAQHRTWISTLVLYFFVLTTP